MTPDKVMAAIGEETYNRLTQEGDDGLAVALMEVVVRFYGLGYEDGLQSGARLTVDAIKARMADRP